MNILRIIVFISIILLFSCEDFFISSVSNNENNISIQSINTNYSQNNISNEFEQITNVSNAIIEKERSVDVESVEYTDVDNVTLLLASARHSQNYSLHTFDCTEMAIETNEFLKKNGYFNKIVFGMQDENGFGHFWIRIKLDGQIHYIEAVSDDNMGRVVGFDEHELYGQVRCSFMGERDIKQNGYWCL